MKYPFPTQSTYEMDISVAIAGDNCTIEFLYKILCEYAWVNKLNHTRLSREQTD